MYLCLVRPNWGTHWQITQPNGLMYVAKAAKNAGHECVIYDAWLKNKSPNEITDDIHLHIWDIIGIQVYHNTIDWTRDFIQIARQFARKAKFIIGGPGAIVLGEKSRLETGADCVVTCEFDTNIDEYLKKIMDGETIISSNNRTDLNCYPLPDYNSIHLPDYWPYMYTASAPTKGKRMAVIQSTRGCPFHCTYCSAGATMGHTVRYRNIDNIIDEVEYLKKRYDIDELWFSDDNLIVNYDRGIELFERLEPYKLHIRLPMGVRWKNVDFNMAFAMKEAGVYFTGIGIESGNPRILKRIKKNINQEKLKKAIGILDAMGISVIGFFIFGLPTETRSEMEETVQWALKTKLKGAQFGTFIPYPGSEDVNEKSLLPHNELVKIQRAATLKFYLRPRIIWSFIKNLKWSQVKALWVHPWVKAWRKIK